MEGAGLAAERQAEMALFQAWHGEAFAREKRLKPLSKYIKSGARKQSPEELLAAFRDFQARGAKMEIRHVPKR